MADLRTLQTALLARITDRDDLRQDGVENLVLGDARLNAEARLQIYADMYWLRLRDVLLDDHPRLAACLGEETFMRLCRAYLTEHPPRDFSLRDLGRALPGYLRVRAFDVERPWLSDLAALEWARADVYDRPDVPVMTLDRVRATDPEVLADLPLVPVPAHAVVTTRWAVDRTWNEPGQTPEEIARRLLVWRRDDDVVHRTVDAAEDAPLQLLLRGTTFGDVCACLTEGREMQEAASLAWETIGGWITTGLITDVDR